MAPAVARAQVAKPPPVTAAQRAVLVIMLASCRILRLDISIVITSLPEIRADPGFTTTGLTSVQNIYTLCFGGFLILDPRVGMFWAAAAFISEGCGRSDCPRWWSGWCRCRGG
jgi:hypothetical protein